MKKNSYTKATGALFIVLITLVLIGNSSLEANFDWDRLPMGEVLTLYHRGGPLIFYSWVIFALGAFLIIPASLLTHKALSNGQPPLFYLGTVFGVLTGISYTIGLMRWIWLASWASNLYSDPGTDQPMRLMLEVVFSAINAYAGHGFGETIAPLCHAVWVMFLGQAMLKSPICPDWLGWTQVICSPVIALRPLEFMGYPGLGAMGDHIMFFWSFTIYTFGIILILHKEKSHSCEHNCEHSCEY